jgi:hypothetical protein
LPRERTDRVTRRDRHLHMLTPRLARELLARRRREIAIDTQIGELATDRTCASWCVDQGWLPSDLFGGLEVTGARVRQDQLRINEARRFMETALTEAMSAALPRRWRSSWGSARAKSPTWWNPWSLFDELGCNLRTRLRPVRRMDTLGIRAPGVTSASIARSLDMSRQNSIDIQIQDTSVVAEGTRLAPENPPIITEGTRLAPDLAAGAGPCADGEVKDGPPRVAAALAGDNGGGTSGNHGNGTAG